MSTEEYEINPAIQYTVNQHGENVSINLNIIRMGKLKANDAGGKVCNITNSLYPKEGYVVQGPPMQCWGAQEERDQQKQPTGKYAVSLQMPSEQYPAPAVQHFRECIEKIVDHLLDQIILDYKTWFPAMASAPTKEMLISMGVVNNVFYVNPAKPEKGATMKVKLPYFQGGRNPGWQTEVYDENGTPLFTQDMQRDETGELTGESPIPHIKMGKLAPLVDLSIWLVNGKITFRWSLKQCSVPKDAPKLIKRGVCAMLPISATGTDSNTYQSSEYENDEQESEFGDDGVDENTLEPNEMSVEVEAEPELTETPTPVVESSAPAPAPTASAATVKKTITKKRSVDGEGAGPAKKKLSVKKAAVKKD